MRLFIWVLTSPLKFWFTLKVIVKLQGLVFIILRYPRAGNNFINKLLYRVHFSWDSWIRVIISNWHARLREQRFFTEKYLWHVLYYLFRLGRALFILCFDTMYWPVFLYRHIYQICFWSEFIWASFDMLKLSTTIQ